MTIYIESFLIQNFFVNFCLLRLVELTTKQKTSLIKMVFAAIFGAILSAVAVASSDIVSNILRVICPVAILMCFKAKFRQHIYNFVLFFMFEFAMLGGFMALKNILKLNNLNIEIFTISTIVLTYLFEFVVKKIKFKIKTNNLIYKITLCNNKNEIKINAFLDTGNLLQYNCQPVVVVDLDSFLKLTKTDLVSFYLTAGESINLSSVAGSNQLKIFKIDKIKVDINYTQKIFENQYIAVNTIGSFKNTNYQALISAQFV